VDVDGWTIRATGPLLADDVEEDIPPMLLLFPVLGLWLLLLLLVVVSGSELLLLLYFFPWLELDCWLLVSQLRLLLRLEL
jgi:hypothetical protein